MFSANYLHTRLCHFTFTIVIRSLWYRVFAKENNLVEVLIDLTSLVFTVYTIGSEWLRISTIGNVSWLFGIYQNAFYLLKYKLSRSIFCFRSSTRLLGRKFILFGLKKVQLGSMTLLFSSFLFIISKFYISTIIVKIQLNDNKFKNINLLFTTGNVSWLFGIYQNAFYLLKYKLSRSIFSFLYM
jgi:hypothetical protein